MALKESTRCIRDVTRTKISEHKFQRGKVLQVSWAEPTTVKVKIPTCSKNCKITNVNQHGKTVECIAAASLPSLLENTRAQKSFN